jgi:hypothetical protein
MIFLVLAISRVAAALIAVSCADRWSQATRDSAVAEAVRPAPMPPAVATPPARPAPSSPEPAPAAGRSTILESTPRNFAAGMVLVVDPETGVLGLPGVAAGRALTISELQDLARAEASGLTTIRNPDGSETLNHEGRFADHSIVRVGPDGKPVFDCVHGEGQLAHALHTTPSATPAAEEK